MKIDKHIDYPDILNLDEYSMNYNEEGNRYKLYGICCQSGGLHGGHYYAVCFNIYDKKWRIYNDSQVTEINKEELSKHNAYCLFYKRE